MNRATRRARAKNSQASSSLQLVGSKFSAKIRPLHCFINFNRADWSLDIRYLLGAFKSQTDGELFPGIILIDQEKYFCLFEFHYYANGELEARIVPASLDESWIKKLNKDEKAWIQANAVLLYCFALDNWLQITDLPSTPLWGEIEQELTRLRRLPEDKISQLFTEIEERFPADDYAGILDFLRSRSVAISDCNPHTV